MTVLAVLFLLSVCPNRGLFFENVRPSILVFSLCQFLSVEVLEQVCP